MTISLFGTLVVLIGSYLLIVGRPLSLLNFVLLLSLMGGTAAIFVDSLGGASVQPAPLGLAFLLMAVVLPGPNRAGHFFEGLSANWALMAFAVYGVIAALFLPRIFEGALFVVPLNPSDLTFLFDTKPLAFSNQNITTAVYLIGTAMAAVCAYSACRTAKSYSPLIKAAIVAAAIHAALGLLEAMFSRTAFEDFLQFFRNANYSQTNQRIGNLPRIDGIFPETSAYSSVAFVWFVLMAEFWLRRIMSLYSGLTAVALLGVLILTLSSTAYVSLGIYAVIMTLRFIFVPGSIEFMRLFVIGWFVLVGLVAVLAGFLFAPLTTKLFGAVAYELTFGKMDSDSGQQRLFWTMRALDAFTTSYGLGIGPGSFRSSSLVFAILGGTGVFGALFFFTYCFKVLKPFRASTYFVNRTGPVALGASFSWAAIMLLVPASLLAPSPDPGLVFGLFCGASLALRRNAQTVPSYERARGPMSVGQPVGQY